MIVFKMQIVCEHYLDVEDPVQCGKTADVPFRLSGMNGTIPEIRCADWPQGWKREIQPDGCEDRHLCPEHAEHHLWGDDGPNTRL